MSEPTSPLQPLYARLRECRTRDISLTEPLLAEAWQRFVATGWERGRLPGASVLAGLLVHDPVVAQLLTTKEHAELLALVELADQRYRERAYPNHHVGNLIAATLKELPT